MNNDVEITNISATSDVKAHGAPESLDAEVRDPKQQATDLPVPSQAEGIKKAFAELDQKGYFTAMDHACCQACGWAEVPDGKEGKAVFYHHIDVSLAAEDPETVDEQQPQNFAHRLHLSWRGDAQEIIQALNDQGLETDWDGSPTTRIAILPAIKAEEQEGGESDAATRQPLEVLDVEVPSTNESAGDVSHSQVKRIAKAFAALEKKGYFTAMDFQCCQSCGWAAVPECSDNVVFYHDQDNYAFYHAGGCGLGEDPGYNISGDLQDKLYLAWSGNAIEIIKALNDQGLETEWDGSVETRIAILPPGGKDADDESTESSKQAD